MNILLDLLLQGIGIHFLLAIGKNNVFGSDFLSRLQVVILIVISFRRIIGSPHLFGFTSVIWGAVGVARTPPGAHHLGLHKKLNPRRLVNPHPRPEGARLSVVMFVNAFSYRLILYSTSHVILGI
jgi:hypothetical protein